MRRSKLTTLGAFLAFGMALRSSEPLPIALSFQSALAKALATNERVLAAQSVVERAGAEAAVARGRRWPDISLTARSTRIDQPIVIDLDPIRQAMLKLHPSVPPTAIPPFQSQVQDDHFNHVTLNATLPLFMGGRIQAGVRAARAGVSSAAEQRRGLAGELTTELAQRYFGLQLATENRGTRQGIRDSIRLHAERAGSLERNGQIARAERLRAEVSLAEAERELAQAVRDEQLARLALSSTLAMDEPVSATTPLFRVAGLPPIESFRAQGARANPGLGRLEAERQRAHEGLRAARGDLFPSLGLFAVRELYTRDLTMLQPTWAVGIALNVPIFQGGQRLQRVNAARSQEQQIGYLFQRARRDVGLLIEQRYRQVEEAQSQLASMETTQTLAEESLRAQQLAFTAGLATSLDVTDAEQALTRVRLGILKAMYDGDVALAGLLEAAGQSERLPEFIAGKTEVGP